jgi:hypothetical protein
MTQRDPQTLRPHPLIKDMRRPAKDSAGWRAFVDDIREHGIVNPVKITPHDVVLDGWSRCMAGRALQLAQVPVVVVPEGAELETIVREARRRNQTKGQMAYTYFPAIEALKEELEGRKLQNLRKVQCSPDTQLSCVSGQKGMTRDLLGAEIGVSGELIRQAGELRRLFAEHPAPRSWSWSEPGVRERYGWEPDQKLSLAEYFEAQIFDDSRPMGLGAALRGIGMLLTADARAAKHGIKHGGGRPEGLDRQLQLFNQVLTDLGNRWEYWEAFDEDAKSYHWETVRTRLADQSPERRAAMAEYYERMAKECRRGPR